ncbi:Triacylglycerol lipase [Klebsormidium nitens]|uniref:Triacylglycerol lipase n=1 Tax=Klebsormidium nitens TaxID=105231 RepID=A0A1Y1HNK2_KLENI|nr:Triacylglycerol lipase [Klebsormidium nitens]|eukprot:GAQ79312.1 Triacylglycerol lipase [Klebsormidium nitens]
MLILSLPYYYAAERSGVLVGSKFSLDPILRMQPSGNGHVGSSPVHKKHHRGHPHLAAVEKRLRDSFRRSYKAAADEAEQLKQDVWSVYQQLRAVVIFVMKRLLFPILQFRDFLRITRYLVTVGWQEGLSAAIVNVLTLNDRTLKDFGRLIERKGNEMFGGYQATDGTKIPLTLIGLLDKRVALQEDTLRLFPSPTPSARPNADVCIMASKIVYEDEAVVRDVIDRVWNSPVQVTEDGRGIKYIEPPKEKFEFLKWFSYARRREGSKGDTVETQAMLIRKGNTIVLAFRGTEPFSAVDWATDFYFPWWEIPALGRVHTGFLQGLGLGFPIDRKHPKRAPPTGAPVATDDAREVEEASRHEDAKLDDFSEYISTCMTRFQAVAERSTLTGTTPAREKFFKDLDDQRAQKKWRFKDNYVLAEKSNKCASRAEKAGEKPGAEKEPREVKNDAPLYWQIRAELLKHIRADPHAHIFITGHSLGGALAALFTGLVAAESDVITQRISALQTFGQPRIGDWTFAWFLHNRLNVPQHRYVRMVYGSDLVPRVPFDSDLFEFKHVGPFHWANSLYHVKNGTFDEQPPLRMLRAHATAVFELFYNTVWQSIAAVLFPQPARRPSESVPQVLARVAALFLPAIGAHSPTNYLNAVRHGMPEGKVKKAPAMVS